MQAEHDGRCPSHLLQAVCQCESLPALAQAGPVTYLDLRVRQALQARPMRRRLLPEGAGPWFCSGASRDDWGDIVFRPCP